MPNIKITTRSGETVLEYPCGTLLSDILARAGLSQPRPCGGRGTCGKCAVRAEGDLSEPDSAELASLGADAIGRGQRLTCRARVAGDVRIFMDNSGDISVGMLYAPDGFSDSADKTAGSAGDSPITSRKDCAGAVIDIGTTTLAAYLFKFPGGICVKKHLALNAQAPFGADVITRIEHALNGGAAELRNAIAGQIGAILSDFGTENGGEIDTCVLTGNTAMLLMYAGLDVSGLAASPFIPASRFGIWEGRTYLPGCVSAFVGADITCAILACDMPEDRISLLADIGTNGEMALYDPRNARGGRYYCCSCAAGPAFEGAGIKMGMPSVAGAINKVFIEGESLGYTTVGDKPPAGICGSGLVDAVACMLKLGVLDETGYLEDDFEIGGGVIVTPEDIRKTQLAKSAVRSGIDALLHECGRKYEDIGRFYIAGGFGSGLDMENAAAIGLIPAPLLDRVIYIGNGAAAGAAMILRSRQQYEKSRLITDSAKTVELAGSAFFAEKFMENMMF